MKGLRFVLIFVATIIPAGCVTLHHHEGTVNLNTFPAKSAQVTKADINSAITKQRAKIVGNPNSDTHFAQLAYLLIENQQYDEGITAAKRSIQLNPSNYAAYHNLGHAYYSQKQYDRALKAYKRAIEIAPAAVTYNRIGALYMDKMDYPKAAQAFSRASELDQDNDSYLMMQARAYYTMGKYDDALFVTNKAIDRKNYSTMGMRLKIEKENTISIMTPMATIERASEGKVPGTLIFTVTSVEKGGPADKAGIKEKDIIRGIGGIRIEDLSGEKIKEYIEGKAPGTPVDVSILAIRQKKTVILERFKDPHLPLKLGIKAEVLAKTGNNDEAVKCATESLDSKQSDNTSGERAKLALGRIYLDRGNYDEVIKLLSGIKESSAARLLEATVYARQGNAKQAVAIYLDIPDLSPKNVPLWSDRKDLMLALKPVAQSHQEKTRQFEAQGRFQEALDELAGALSLAMDDKEADEVRNSIFQMVRRMPQPPEMSEDVRKCVLRGEILVKEGDLEGAISEYKKAIRLAPFSAKRYLNTALIYEELKNYPEAIRYLKIYLQAAPDAPNARAAKDEIIKWELLMERGE